MKSHSDINLIRHYCNINHIEIFDSGYHYQMEFNHLSESVYRKYMSRLVEEGFFQYISKGLYFVGYKMPNDIDEKIERFFMSNGRARGIYGGQTLLFKLGIVENKPKTTEIISPRAKKNRNVRNFYIRPLKSITDRKDTLELLELIAIYNKNSDVDIESSLLMAIGERIKTFSGFEADSLLSLSIFRIDYPRIVYVKLANLLDSLHISNEVMQWYEYKTNLSNNEGDSGV